MNNKNITPDFVKNFKIAYNELYNLHPKATEEDFRFRYLKVDWFFPNHLHNVLIQIQEMSKKYFDDIDIQTCLYAGLFHDAGLVYKRESANPTGHENRSVEYAEIELKKLGYDDNFISKVSESIKSTEPDYDSPLPEAVLVRNADAYAHIVSMHFFAKSNFNKDIYSFIDWFDKKIKSTYSKISIPELQEEIKPLFSCYIKMIKNYRDNKDDRNFIDKLLS